MIYLDYQATTPLAPEAREAMLRWLDGPGGTGFGNPHSPHRLGRQADAAIELARQDDYDYVVVNETGQVTRTAERIETIIADERRQHAGRRVRV